MSNDALFTLVEQQLESFGDTYFERPPVNRFEQFLAGGHDAFPVLFDVLTSDAADEGSRTEALLGVGRILTSSALRRVHLMRWLSTQKSLHQGVLARGERRFFLLSDVPVTKA